MHQSELKHTPLTRIHEQLGARMVPFAGFLMPVQYRGIIEEHMAVRTAVGMFDVSHMGEFFIEGPGATDSIDHLVTHEIRSLEPGRARYTVMLNDQGGIIDDLLVYRLSDQRWMMVVNAANIEKDRAWVTSHLDNAVLEDKSSDTALIAVQGPQSPHLIERLLPDLPDQIRYYRFTTVEIDQTPVIVSRTGYTGEDGFEIYAPASAAVPIWEKLMALGQPLGLLPCGLGARDTLRLEAGMLLYGQDMDESVTPLDVGLNWVVRLEKGPFIGRDALLNQKQTGPRFRLIGFEMVEPGIARHGYDVLNADQQPIGVVTSGTHAPFLKKRIGLARVPADFDDDRFFVLIRNRPREAQRVPLPFYKRPS